MPAVRAPRWKLPDTAVRLVRDPHGRWVHFDYLVRANQQIANLERQVADLEGQLRRAQPAVEQ